MEGKNAWFSHWVRTWALIRFPLANVRTPVFKSEPIVLESYCSLLGAQNLKVAKNPNDYHSQPKDTWNPLYSCCQGITTWIPPMLENSLSYKAVQAIIHWWNIFWVYALCQALGIRGDKNVGLVLKNFILQNKFPCCFCLLNKATYFASVDGVCFHFPFHRSSSFLGELQAQNHSPLSDPKQPYPNS